MAKPALFQHLALIGVGLIGSSIARIARREGIAAEIVGADVSVQARADLKELKLCDRVVAEAGDAADGADLIIVCTPISAYAQVARRSRRISSPARS